MRKKTKIWLDGFINGIVTGGVSSVLSALGIVAAESAGVDIKGLNWQQLCGIFFSACVVNACMYIKQNQLPPIFNGENSGFITKEQVTTITEVKPLTPPEEPKKPS